MFTVCKVTTVQVLFENGDVVNHVDRKVTIKVGGSAGLIASIGPSPKGVRETKP